MKTFREYLAEAKIEGVDLNESITWNEWRKGMYYCKFKSERFYIDVKFSKNIIECYGADQEGTPYNNITTFKRDADGLEKALKYAGSKSDKDIMHNFKIEWVLEILK